MTAYAGGVGARPDGYGGRMDTSRESDPSSPDPSEFDGGQPEMTDDEAVETDGPDVLFPDTLKPTVAEGALPAGDEGDLVEQAEVVETDDDEEERRG